MGNHSDFVYAGPGNDSIYALATTTQATKYLVGGSGDDAIRSSYGADILYGDFADAPVYVTSTQWQTPASADPAVVDGNDYLYGNYGPDTIYGGGDDVLIGDANADNSYDNRDKLHGGDGNDQLMGGTAADSLMGDDGDDVLMGQRYGDTLDGGDGNDMLNGGPRGSGWTDVLTGGAGSDAFMLSYTPASSSDTSDGQSFWQSWAVEYVPESAESGVSKGISTLGKVAAVDFFASIGGSILLGGLSTALGGVVGTALSFLFHQSKSATPQPSGEDVMVVTDFDPRADVLFLPLDTGGSPSDATTLVSNVVNFGETGNPNSATGQDGWGVQFTKGTSNTIFAEVLIDAGFLADFGITSNNVATVAFIDDLFANAMVIDANGVQQSDQVYPFPTDPSAYTDGAVPTVADTPVPFEAPSGTLTRVYGAFGPQVIVGPSVVSNNTYVAGTGMGDLVFITTSGFAPDDWDNPAVVAQVANATLVKGYDGDDILNGSSGEPLSTAVTATTSSMAGTPRSRRSATSSPAPTATTPCSPPSRSTDAPLPTSRGDARHGVLRLPYSSRPPRPAPT